MMSREDIIDGLRFTAGMVTFNPLNGETIAPEELNEQDKLTYDACMSAIDLLKAQEPMEPIKTKYFTTLCGQCRHEIDKLVGDKFCPHCGRAVKWE